MSEEFDALIIGAGPAGSSAAILLASAGWRIGLVEKHRFPRRKVCGECIAASNFPILKALNVADQFFALAGPPLRQVALMLGQRTIRAELPPYAEGQHRWGVALGREHLDSLLVAQAVNCGVRLFQPWIVRHIEGQPGDFRCEIQVLQGTDCQILTAPVLIAAHGSWEPIQSGEIRQDWPRRDSDLFAFKANFSNANLECGLLPVLAFPGGYGGMVVGDHGSTTLAFCIRRDRLEHCRKTYPGHKAAQAAVEYVAQSCAGVRNMLAGATQRGTWLSVGPIRPGIRISSQVGAAFLIGNAAGEAHPIIGEGISMAMQSACVLAEKLAPHRGQLANVQCQAQLQKEYAAAWRHHFANRIRLAAMFAHAAMRPAVSRSMLPILANYPALLSHFARWSGKIHTAPALKTQPLTAEYQ